MLLKCLLPTIINTVNTYIMFSAIVRKNIIAKNMRQRNTVSNPFTICINRHAPLILSIIKNQFLNGIVSFNEEKTMTKKGLLLKERIGSVWGICSFL